MLVASWDHLVLPLPNFHCSGLGVVPKHNGGGWAIYYLSIPCGLSSTDSIDWDTYTLSYCSIDDAFAIVLALGKDILMAKKIPQKCLSPHSCTT